MNSNEIKRILAGLSRKESFVLFQKLWGKEHSNIAEMMSLSEDRVQQHSSSVFQKFGLGGKQWSTLKGFTYTIMLNVAKPTIWNDWRWPPLELLSETEQSIPKITHTDIIDETEEVVPPSSQESNVHQGKRENELPRSRVTIREITENRIAQIIAIVVVVVSCFIFVVWLFNDISNPFVLKETGSPMINTTTVATNPTEIDHLSATISISTLTPTPTPTSFPKDSNVDSGITPSFTPTIDNIPTVVPTIGIGSTMIWEEDGSTMLYVPEGEFLMGADGKTYAEDDEKPQHSVYLDSFWIDQSEVTVGMFQKFVSETGILIINKKSKCYEYGPFPTPKYIRQNGGGYFKHESWNMNDVATEVPCEHDATNDKLPQVDVTWFEAEAYCEWAGKRLPTEAEWEKAARGTDGRLYTWGDFNTDDLENYFLENNYYFSYMVVGNNPIDKSIYSVFDMAGNVGEWIADWYDSEYYKNSPYMNPSGPNRNYLGQKVARGGPYVTHMISLRVSARKYFNPSSFYNDIGFRCVISSK